ncbi:DNA cytosine methyltransferase [Klebsiella oxytoca]|uniref:DNA cytosine methyltransferase n=1 Tax=Klebsiella oxytoca TaxID=571 RepID=UPI0007CC8554|nr:DNA cytosine methyltransferase [Klebsiella oxytoca]DAH61046.1 MAG TPA: Cytosine specific methyltransferase [Caudoviricetes sp.]MBR7596278.1 DNA cytosine methyltransferase [Klebsiella oxytoca]MBZ7528519.1 DNA cytosine methyltransferase [Klebsiella oxytoca]MBZ7648061.1 DNA cytosine methyltransferase [Klebsiella oxytoca]MDU4655899.1 DNA cytosine methyltransferase [Klebsiella oxytoca]
MTSNLASVTYGSVCSGIEAASVAWESLNWKAEWFAEIEKFPSAVLQHHWPNIPNLGDMTRIAGRIREGTITAPAVLVGGTPCQAFSVAGKRKGLDDERGKLTLSFVELADQIDNTRIASGKEPAIILWENVTGVLNSHDNAFGCFLGALAGEGCALQPAGKKWANAGVVSGPSRTVAWRVLNAEFFGVPQSRKRVFVMASARREFDPGMVLFEFPTLPPRTAKYYGAQKKTGTRAYTGIEREFHRYCLRAIPETAGTLLASYNGTSNQDMRMRGGLIVEVTPSLRVRRLTPSECERLQGFPVGHTNIPWRSNSPLPRYKALGNSMPVPVMKWLGERIQNAISST